MAKKREALHYHQYPKPGKVAISSTKPCDTALDLALAYSPGVAHPCNEIASKPQDVYKYTSKGNLVAVITDGTAVLGLGNIGPAASKPVMEGKGVLFKTFADIDVFDLELDTSSVDQFVNTVVALAPTFGGINLEDIKAPECFHIEEQLKERLDIPVFHDDQHGTAIIVAAGFINALHLTKRSFEEITVVFSGAGAAAIACAKLLVNLGVKKQNIVLCDSKGVIHTGRTDLNAYKQEFATNKVSGDLEEALKGADAFMGLSKKDILSPEMLKSMANDPIVFAMANPDPEISYPLAKKTRSDVIMATGRSDYPNQINNVLGFPYIFRGALDAESKLINEEMKMAAANALAELAREPVPESVSKAYDNNVFSFGPDYLIPKPFDPRVLYYVAPAVAKAAIDSGVARKKIDIKEYTDQLKAKQHQGRILLGGFFTKARQHGGARIVFSEGSSPRVIKAASHAKEEGIAHPILVGRKEHIINTAQSLDVDHGQFEIIDPRDTEHSKFITDKLFETQHRKGVTRDDAERMAEHDHFFSAMFVKQGLGDGLISGVDRYFPMVVRPMLDIIGRRENIKTIAGLYLVHIDDRLFFFADTSINIDMDEEKLSNIAVLAAEFAESMNCKPSVAFLSFSNFGSVRHPSVYLIQKAKELFKRKMPHVIADGEMQADTAVMPELLFEHYDFTSLKEQANVLIFPDMQSGNIAYKLLQRLGGARVIGPIMLGLDRPVHVLQRHASAEEIFDMTTVAAAQAAFLKEK